MRLERLDHLIAREEPTQPTAAVHDWELVLCAADEALYRVLDPALRRQAFEPGNHRIRDQHAARYLAQLRRMRLGCRGEVDEEGDEDRIGFAPSRPKRPKAKAAAWPTEAAIWVARGVAQAMREVDPQHTPAVHWEHRDQVEVQMSNSVINAAGDFVL